MHEEGDPLAYIMKRVWCVRRVSLAYTSRVCGGVPLVSWYVEVCMRRVEVCLYIVRYRACVAPMAKPYNII